MSLSIKKQLQQHYQFLLKRHGIEGDAAQQALSLMHKGYTNDAAIRLAKAGGDHRVLLQGR